MRKAPDRKRLAYPSPSTCKRLIPCYVASGGGLVARSAAGRDFNIRRSAPTSECTYTRFPATCMQGKLYLSGRMEGDPSNLSLGHTTSPMSAGCATDLPVSAAKALPVGQMWIGKGSPRHHATITTVRINSLKDLQGHGSTIGHDEQIGNQQAARWTGQSTCSTDDKNVLCQSRVSIHRHVEADIILYLSS